MADEQRPIIVKRIKKSGGGHHGGAWKIAYADFVTAMMAFFLLMWLLGSTSEGDKKGIADYFGSPLKLALLNGGTGSGDSSHVVKGGGEDLTRTTGQVKRGEIKAERATVNVHKLKAEQVRAEVARLEDLKRKVEAKLEGNAKLQGMSSQILLEMTPDGLRIQIVDEDKRPMFPSGSAGMLPQMRELLRVIGSVLADVPNRLTLEGHTDSTPFGLTPNGHERGTYSNWELSSDRANASRRELILGGLPDEQVLRVQGLAASVPFDRRDPTAPANRRISIVVMTREAEERVFLGAVNNAPAPEVPEAPEAPKAVANPAPAASTALSSPSGGHR